MKTFLSIPSWRSMKHLHGLLGYVSIAALVSWFVPSHFIKPGHPELVAMLQWANFLALLTFSPFFIWAYGRMSSNQY